MQVNERICDRCLAKPTVRKSEKFCKDCRKEVLAELRDAGYLTYAPEIGSRRTQEQKELTHETKYGTFHG